MPALFVRTYHTYLLIRIRRMSVSKHGTERQCFVHTYESPDLFLCLLLFVHTIIWVWIRVRVSLWFSSSHFMSSAAFDQAWSQESSLPPLLIGLLAFRRSYDTHYRFSMATACRFPSKFANWRSKPFWRRNRPQRKAMSNTYVPGSLLIVRHPRFEPQRHREQQSTARQQSRWVWWTVYCAQILEY